MKVHNYTPCLFGLLPWKEKEKKYKFIHKIWPLRSGCMKTASYPPCNQVYKRSQQNACTNWSTTACGVIRHPKTTFARWSILLTKFIWLKCRFALRQQYAIPTTGVRCHKDKPGTLWMYSFLLVFLCTSCKIAHTNIVHRLFLLQKQGSSWKWPNENLKWTDHIHSLIQKLLISSTTEFFVFRQSFYWFTFPAAWPHEALILVYILL